MTYLGVKLKKESLDTIWEDYWEKVREKMYLKWRETQ